MDSSDRLNVGRYGWPQQTTTMKPRHLSTIALLALALAPPLVMAGEPVADCVALGDNQEIIRAGGGNYILLRDDQAHYRLEFARNCGSVTRTPTIKISADGQPDKLCPSNTTVQTHTSTCAVKTVELVSAEDFAKGKRRARR